MSIARTGTNTTTSAITGGRRYNKPSGANTGDILFVFVVSYDDDTQVITAPVTPTGWTLVDRANFGGYITLAIYWHVIGASESTYDFLSTHSAAMGGATVSYSGCDAATPIDAHSNNSGNGASAVGTSVTTTVASTELIWAFTGDTESVTGNPSGMSTALSYTFDSGDQRISEQAITGTGATGSRSVTMTGTDDYAVVMFALRPATGGLGAQAPGLFFGAFP